MATIRLHFICSEHHFIASLEAGHILAESNVLDSHKKQKLVVFSGAGISAESGLNTFRDADGLWDNYPIEQVATPEGWRKDPVLVLEFYNQRRRDASAAQPNAAHKAIASLENQFDVTVITQNVDDLHERAGSSFILHLHGELNKARSSIHPELIYSIGDQPILTGDRCAKGSQLRPHIVWFGEYPFGLDDAAKHISEADIILVVGTSLSVEPAASLLEYASNHAEKIVQTLDIDRVPQGFQLIRGKASEFVPKLCASWLDKA